MTIRPNHSRELSQGEYFGARSHGRLQRSKQKNAKHIHLQNRAQKRTAMLLWSVWLSQKRQPSTKTWHGHSIAPALFDPPSQQGCVTVWPDHGCGARKVARELRCHRNISQASRHARGGLDHSHPAFLSSSGIIGQRSQWEEAAKRAAVQSHPQTKSW